MTDSHIPRPQPIGLTPWPHGALLFPEGEGVAEFASHLVREGSDSVSTPASLEFWALARQGDEAGALHALKQSGGSIAFYNRFVLAPDAAEYARLSQSFAEAGEDELQVLLDLAAYQSGLLAEPPTQGATSLDGELQGYAQTIQAASRLERVNDSSDLEIIDQHLNAGFDAALQHSPGLAAQCVISHAEVMRSYGAEPRQVEAVLRKGLQALPENGFAQVRGELSLELGGLLHETAPTRLGESVGLFQDALRLLDPSVHRRAYGFAQMRLGLVYLSMSMSDAGDALRMGVATQSLRESLKTLSPEHEPDLWCAAATNLANAYQLLPSGHLSENLEESVRLYSEVVQIRSVELDPLGHARALSNRANALASLERLDQAVQDLSVACPLLQQHGGAEELEAARRMLEAVKRSTITGDTELMGEGLGGEAKEVYRDRE